MKTLTNKREERLRNELTGKPVDELRGLARKLDVKNFSTATKAELIDKILEVGLGKVSRCIGLTRLHRCSNWCKDNPVWTVLAAVAVLATLVGTGYGIASYYRTDPAVAAMITHGAEVQTQLAERELTMRTRWLDLENARIEIAWDAQYFPELVAAVERLEASCNDFRRDHLTLSASQANILAVADAMTAFAHGHVEKVSSILSDELARSLNDDTTVPRKVAVQANVVLGWSFNAQERWSESLNCFQRVATLLPDDFNAAYWSAEAYSRLEQWKSAASCYSVVVSKLEPIVATEPDNVVTRNHLGLTQLGRARAYAELARAQDARKDYEQATAHLEHAAKTLDLPVSWFNLGGAHSQMGKYLAEQHNFADAIKHFDTARTFFAKSGDSQAALAVPLVDYHLGSARFRLGAYDGAIEDLERSVRGFLAANAVGRSSIDTTLELALMSLGLTFAIKGDTAAKRGDNDAAIRCYTQGVERVEALANRNERFEFKWQLALLHARRASALRSQKKLADAIDDCRRVAILREQVYELARNNKHARELQKAYGNLGTLLSGVGNRKEALGFLTKATELTDTSQNDEGLALGRALFRRNRASVLWQEERFADALSDGGKAVAFWEGAGGGDRIDLDPEGAVLAFCDQAKWLACCRIDSLRDGKLALRLSRHICQRTGWSESRCLDAHAAAHAELGDFAEASRWQTKAIDLAPEHEREAYRAVLKLYEASKPRRL